MHELPLIKSIFEAAMESAKENDAKRIKAVYLQIGVLRDFEITYIVKYWKYVTKDTIADGSTIVVDDIPATVQCRKCGRIYPILKDSIEEAKCPGCGSEEGNPLTGREVILDHIDIE